MANVVIFCFMVMYLWKKLRQDTLDEDERNENVCLLKNALLTYHLLHQKGQDFENYNDTNPKLPSMAGCTFEHACFTYLLPRRIDRNTPFYTKVMEEKGDKIRKYLCREFDHPDKSYAFFKDVVEKDIKKQNYHEGLSAPAGWGGPICNRGRPMTP